MKIVTTIAQAATQWVDLVAQTISDRAAFARKGRRILLSEDEGGMLSVREGPADLPALSPLAIADGRQLPEPWLKALRGSAVVLLLSPARIVTRSVDLPAKGVDFLQGILRSQIDRLTPWSPEEAAFQHGKPRPVGDDQVRVTVIATAAAAVKTVLRPFVDAGAASVEAVVEAAEDGPLTLLVERAGGGFEREALRRGLGAGLGAAVLAALAASIIGSFLIPFYGDQLSETQRRISKHRAMIGRMESEAGDSPRKLLLRRKQASPFAVLAVEDLSALLPDDSFVTELRMEGDKLQVKGLTQDAPALIRLLEQSRHFANAGFFAPTTRSPGEAGERFSLETQIKSRFGAGS